MCLCVSVYLYPINRHILTGCRKTDILELTDKDADKQTEMYTIICIVVTLLNCIRVVFPITLLVVYETFQLIELS